MVVMMKIFERQMRQVFRKEKLIEYAINLGKKADIDDSRFYKNNNGTMVCDVLICFPDEFEELLQDHQNLQSQIQSLEKTLSEKEKSIEMLENRLSSIDGGNQKEIKKIEEEYSERIDGLNNDLHDKDIEIEKVKTEYEKKIGELNIFNPEYHMKISDHEKALNKMRGNCLKLRVRENKKYSSYIEDLDNLGRFSKLRNKDKSILKEMRHFNRSAIDEEAIDVQFNLIEDNSGREEE